MREVQRKEGHLDTSHPDNAGAIWCSVEDLQVQQREWYYQAIQGVHSELRFPLRRISNQERVVLDFGACNCLRPSEVVLVVGATMCVTSAVSIHLAGVSDFEANPRSLVKGMFAAVSDQDQRFLRIEVPETRRHFYRMFSIHVNFVDDVLVPNCWTLCCLEFFGQYLEALPSTLFPTPLREPFVFDSASSNCRLITQI